LTSHPFPFSKLAVVGCIAQEYLPQLYPGMVERNPFKAPFAVPTAANVQIFLAIAVVELAYFKYQYKLEANDEPWNFGWGLKMLEGKSAAQVADMKLKELVHCRLAMIAFVGIVAQTGIYNAPLLGGSF
jgi:hypothetical protein